MGGRRCPGRCANFGDGTVDDSLRWQIDREGSSRAEVEAACGEPTQVDNGAIYRGTATAAARVSPTWFAAHAVAQPVEIWTYNFGPSMLMQRIRFVDGVVVSLEHLGYGYPLP